MRKVKDIPVEVRAAALAQQLGHEMGLRDGNLWVVGVARSIERQWRTDYCHLDHGWTALAQDMSLSLGIAGTSCA